MYYLLLQYSAEISPESIRHVHHLVVYLCDGMNLTGHPDVGVNHDCNGISEAVVACRSSAIIAAWAVGGNVSNTGETIASKLATVIINLYTMLICSYVAIYFYTGF